MGKARDGECEIDVVHAAPVVAAKAALPGEHDLQRAADAFAALSHPTRLKILKALEGRELCVCDVSQVLSMSVSATSHQLRELRTLGAVEYRAEGKMAYYSIRDMFWSRLADSVLARFATSERKPIKQKAAKRA